MPSSVAHRRPRRSVPGALVLGVLAATVGLSGAGPAPAAAAAAPAREVYAVPASRVFSAQGHGYGHGRGLSQWGAQGAATLGRSATTILDTYYPGTAATTIGDAPVRVALTRSGAEGRPPTSTPDDGRYECDSASSSAAVRCVLEVPPASGLAARDEAGPAAATLPATVGGAAVTRWRVRDDAAGLHLEALTGSGWQPVALGGRTAVAGPVTFSAPGAVPVRYADGSVWSYRGTVGARRVSDTRVARVNTVGLEDYLRGVVPKESPASWQPAALQAQAVAARSYSAWYRGSRASSAWQICDSTSCQVYGGRSVQPAGGAAVSQEDARTDAAIAATRGSVRTYGGGVVRAEFTASNGGWSTSGGAGWLPARADAWDGAVPNGAHSWSTDLPASAIERRYGLQRLDALAVLSRDGHGEWGGRVLDVELRGLDAAGAPVTVRTTGDGIRAAWPLAGSTGLRSSWFVLAQPPAYEIDRGAWSRTAGTVELAARTPAGSVEVTTWTASGGLGPAVQLGGVVSGGPAVASRGTGDAEVFVRGTNDRLYTSRRGGGTWSRWADLGGVVTGRPAATRYGDEVHVFVRGGDGALWHRWTDAAGAWHDWESLGGSLAAGTAPAAVSPAAGRLDVVVHAPDGTAERRSYEHGWGGWTSLGGTVAGDPALGSAAGESTLVVRTPDGSFATRTLSGGAGWSSLGGVLAADPSVAAAPGSGRLDVVATGTNGRLYRRTRTSSGWSSWASVS